MHTAAGERIQRKTQSQGPVDGLANDLQGSLGFGLVAFSIKRFGTIITSVFFFWWRGMRTLELQTFFFVDTHMRLSGYKTCALFSLLLLLLLLMSSNAVAVGVAVVRAVVAPLCSFTCNVV